jgi:hypothetical protein
MTTTEEALIARAHRYPWSDDSMEPYELAHELIAMIEALVAERDAATIHRPETRYSYDDGESSADTREQAEADYGEDFDTDQPELETWDVCAICGPIEVSMRDQYEDSHWPCRIARDAILAQPDDEAKDANS